MKNDKEMSEKMNEFLNKVDALCFEYGYEIHPTIHGWTGKTDENGKYKTIAIIGNDEIGEVIYIDGDGRGKQILLPITVGGMVSVFYGLLTTKIN